MKHLSLLALSMLLATSLIACDKDGDESTEEHGDHAEHADHEHGESTSSTTSTSGSTTGTDSGSTTATDSGSTTEGGSTTGSDTGESGGTDTSGTGGTGGDLCGGAADDDPCTACTKQNCCNESLACAVDAGCRCGLECVAQGKSNEVCAAECMGFDPNADPYGSLVTCVVYNCAAACLGG